MQAASLFCQDLREEVGGAVSLMGIMPDNVQGAAPEAGTIAQLGKLVVYTRINLRLDEPIEPIVTFLRIPDGQEVGQQTIGLEVVEQAFREAREQDNVLAGLVVKVEMVGIPFTPGRLTMVLKYNGEEYIAGSIRFLFLGEAQSS